jgi:hypothetical protein
MRIASKRVLLCLAGLSLAMLHAQPLSAHYRRQQYLLAEEGLGSVISDLSVHVNTLEEIAAQWQTKASGLGDPSAGWAVTAAIEIVQHQAMRAWYNRLLLQNLSDEGVSLGQMATVLRLSLKPLSNGIYQVTKLCSNAAIGGALGSCEQAAESLRALSGVYEKALKTLKTAMGE